MVQSWEAYEEWQGALAAEFFGGSQAGLPVIFYVDNEILGEITERLGIDVSLADAVRPLVRRADHSHAFGLIHERAHRHYSLDAPPPSLPLLALSVLAATQMVDSNYYTPFTKLLYGDPVQERTRAVMLNSFPAVVDLWHRLDEWLDRTDGRFGTSTISTKDNPYWGRIGLPLSQALIRRSDRMLLTQFFHDIELVPERTPSSSELIRHLRIWASSTSKKLSNRFRRALGSETDESLITDLVRRLAASWDGTVLDASTGNRMIRLALAFTPRPARMHWTARSVPGIASGNIQVADGTAHQFDHNEGSFYRGIGQVPFTPAALISGYRLHGQGNSGESLTLVYQPEQIVIFREDPYLGCWVSQDTTTAYDEHLVLVSPQVCFEVESILREASPGIRKVDSEHIRSVLPADWRLYRNVQFTDPESLAHALRFKSNASADRLRPTPVGRPKLIGGLAVARHLSRHHYLKGGAPDLLLAIHEEGARQMDVALDGQLQQPPFVANGFPVPLASLQLDSGKHEIAVDKEVLKFTLVDRLIDEPTHRTGAVGFLLNSAPKSPHPVAATNMATSLDPEQPGIRGCSGIGSIPFQEPRLVQRGARRTLFIGQQGRVLDFDEPEQSTWWQDVVGIPAYYFEVELARDESGWLVQQFARRTVAKPVGESLPDIAAIRNAPDRDFWVETVLSVSAPDPSALWISYRAAAEELSK